MTNPLAWFALSLLATIVFELAFYLLVGKRNLKDATLVVLVNVITNPVAQLTWWILLAFTDWPPLAIKIGIELVVIIWEGFLFGEYGSTIRKPFHFATGINAVSFALGELLLSQVGIFGLISYL